MSLRLYGTISGCGRAAGAVIPSLGSGRYAPGPNIGLPSSLKCEAPKYTINAGWGQPGSLATVSDDRRSRRTGAQLDHRAHPRRCEGRQRPRGEVWTQAQIDAAAAQTCTAADRPGKNG